MNLDSQVMLRSGYVQALNLSFVFTLRLVLKEYCGWLEELGHQARVPRWGFRVRRRQMGWPNLGKLLSSICTDSAVGFLGVISLILIPRCGWTLKAVSIDSYPIRIVSEMLSEVFVTHYFHQWTVSFNQIYSPILSIGFVRPENETSNKL